MFFDRVADPPDILHGIDAVVIDKQLDHPCADQRKRIRGAVSGQSRTDGRGLGQDERPRQDRTDLQEIPPGRKRRLVTGG